MAPLAQQSASWHHASTDLLRRCQERRLRKSTKSATGAKGLPAAIVAEEVEAREAVKLCTRLLEGCGLECNGKSSQKHEARLLFAQAALLLERARAHGELRCWSRTIKDCAGVRALTLEANEARSEADREADTEPALRTVSWLLLEVAALELQAAAQLRHHRTFLATFKRSLALLRQLSTEELSTGFGSMVFRQLVRELKWIVAAALEASPCNIAVSLAQECAKETFIFLLQAWEATEKAALCNHARVVALLSGSKSDALELLVNLAAQPLLACQIPALECLRVALQKVDGIFADRYNLVLSPAHACLQLREAFDERPHLYLRFLVEVVATPAGAAGVRLTSETLPSLLCVISRQETAGAATLAAVLLIGALLPDDVRANQQPALLRSATVLARRVAVAQCAVEDVLAFVQLRALITFLAEVQDGSPSVGFRLQPLFSGQCEQHSEHFQAADELSAAAAPALLASLHRNALANDGRGKSAGLAETELGFVVGMEWTETKCSKPRLDHLLLAWLLDFDSPRDDPTLAQRLLRADIGNGVGAKAETLVLDFLEAQLLSAPTAGHPCGALECLHYFLQYPEVRAQARHRAALFERLLAVCDHGRASVQTTATERAHACAALAELLGDNTDGERWALRLLPVRGPSRALRWATNGTVNAAAAYSILRLAVQRGGSVLATEVCRQCPTVFDQAASLRAALSRKPDSANAESQAAAQEWRLLCASVLVASCFHPSTSRWSFCLHPVKLASLAAEAAAEADESEEEFVAQLQFVAATARAEIAAVESEAEAQLAVACGARQPTTSQAAAAAALRASGTRTALRTLNVSELKDTWIRVQDVLGSR